MWRGGQKGAFKQGLDGATRDLCKKKRKGSRRLESYSVLHALVLSPRLVPRFRDNREHVRLLYRRMPSDVPVYSRCKPQKMRLSKAGLLASAISLDAGICRQQSANVRRGT